MSDFDLYTLWYKLDYLIDLKCGYDHFKWFKWSLSGAGKTIILPPTITDSPRWYMEQTHDALPLTRRMGKPTLFITFTCNTKWREITDSLHPGDSPFDRPDICARVFKQKVDMALEEIVKKEIFGELIWFNWIIEWQKRKGCHTYTSWSVWRMSPAVLMRWIGSFQQRSLTQPTRDSTRQSWTIWFTTLMSAGS